MIEDPYLAAARAALDTLPKNWAGLSLTRIESDVVPSGLLFAYTKSRDYIRNQLQWLEREVGAIRTRDEGTETSAVITRAGRDHVERRSYLVGVQHPGDPE